MQDNLEPVFYEHKKHGGDNSIRIERLLAKLLVYWPVFVVSALLCVAVAYIYLRYTTPKYMVYAKVLVKDDKKTGGSGEGQLLQELGLQSSAVNVENETEIFKSRSLMQKVVADRQLNIHYFAPGRVKTSEYYYKDLPYSFTPLFDNYSVTQRTKYNLEISDTGFVISNSKNKWTGRWGDTVELPLGKVVIGDRRSLANPAYDLRTTQVEIKATEYQAIKLLRSLTVKPVNKATILELAVSDILPQRGEDLLNELISAYLQANVDDRNKTLEATVSFINDRLRYVTGELSGIEKDIEHFKSTNRLTDLSEQSKQLLDYTSEYARQLTEKEVKLKVVESLEEYLSDERNKDRIVPSSLLVEDDAAMNAMKSYNDLQLKRAVLLMSNTEDNPYVRNVDRQLANIREDLTRSLATMKKGIKVSITELKSRTGFVDEEIRKVPQNERVFLEYSRQQNIKQELYLFLLKKQEETAISKSSTVANARIIDPAKSEMFPFSPHKGRTYLAAIVLGLLLPGIWVFLRELLNVKIGSREDVKMLTGMEIIAEIGHSDNGDEIVVQKESRTVIAEQFRTMRTNMQFLLNDKPGKTILVTSSMSGEGKSFVALNLAVTLGLSGEKVALLELDLRKPKISSSLSLGAGNGFTEYAAGLADIQTVIRPSGVLKNMDIISSGNIPPNPSELLLSPGVKDMFEYLKNEYDYIVVDTAPIGLVTDAQLLSRYAQVSIYVSRISYTYKEQVRHADELWRSGKIPRMYMVINDTRARAGAYGYGYGYGSYGEDYLAGNKKKDGLFSSLRKTFKRTS